jgi:hypothetical protein
MELTTIAISYYSNCTIYLPSAFGHVKVEARNVQARIAPYAQHREAVSITWVPKGKRKARVVIVTPVNGELPLVAVLKGHGFASPPDPFETVETNDRGMAVSRTRATCFDPSFAEEAAQTVKAQIARGAVVLFATR